MSVFEATERELTGLGRGVAGSALAANALALAEMLDDRSNSATSRSMCAKAHLDVMNRLRELAPPVREADNVDEIGRKRKQRRRAAGISDSEA